MPDAGRRRFHHTAAVAESDPALATSCGSDGELSFLLPRSTSRILQTVYSHRRDLTSNSDSDFETVVSEEEPGPWVVGEPSWASRAFLEYAEHLNQALAAAAAEKNEVLLGLLQKHAHITTVLTKRITALEEQLQRAVQVNTELSSTTEVQDKAANDMAMKLKVKMLEVDALRSYGVSPGGAERPKTLAMDKFYQKKLAALQEQLTAANAKLRTLQMPPVSREHLERLAQAVAVLQQRQAALKVQARELTQCIAKDTSWASGVLAQEIPQYLSRLLPPHTPPRPPPRAAASSPAAPILQTSMAVTPLPPAAALSPPPTTFLSPTSEPQPTALAYAASNPLLVCDAETQTMPLHTSEAGTSPSSPPVPPVTTARLPPSLPASVPVPVAFPPQPPSPCLPPPPPSPPSPPPAVAVAQHPPPPPHLVKAVETVEVTPQWVPEVSGALAQAVGQLRASVGRLLKSAGLEGRLPVPRAEVAAPEVERRTRAQVTTLQELVSLLKEYREQMVSKEVSLELATTAGQLQESEGETRRLQESLKEMCLMLQARRPAPTSAQADRSPSRRRTRPSHSADGPRGPGGKVPAPGGVPLVLCPRASVDVLNLEAQTPSTFMGTIEMIRDTLGKETPEMQALMAQAAQLSRDSAASTMRRIADHLRAQKMAKREEAAAAALHRWQQRRLELMLRRRAVLGALHRVLSQRVAACGPQGLQAQPIEPVVAPETRWDRFLIRPNAQAAYLTPYCPKPSRTYDHLLSPASGDATAPASLLGSTSPLSPPQRHGRGPLPQPSPGRRRSVKKGFASAAEAPTRFSPNISFARIMGMGGGPLPPIGSPKDSGSMSVTHFVPAAH